MNGDESLPQRYERSMRDQQDFERLLQPHRPTKDDNGETICEACLSAAPCDHALDLMRKIQRARAFRIAVHQGVIR